MYELAILTGFLSAGFFAISMILALRLVVLDRFFGGLGRLYRWHHRVGMAAFVLMLLHPLLLGIWTLQTQPGMAVDMLWPNPESMVVFTGWISLLCFVAFFVATVIPQIPYRAWRFIHRGAALGYLVMGAHMVLVGSGSVAAKITIGLLGVGLLAFLYRVLRQDLGRGGLSYRVVSVTKRDEDVLDVVLEPLSKSLEYEVGQFAYLAISDSEDLGGCGELHPYTMTSIPGDSHLSFSIKALGPCTRHLQSVRLGTAATVKGPYGALFPVTARKSEQVWIGGGVGITPFLAGLKAKQHSGGVALFYAARNLKSARFLSDLKSMAETSVNVNVYTILEDTDGRPSTEMIVSKVGGIEGKHFVIAGPTAMVESLTEGLLAEGVSKSCIHSELGVLR